MEQVNVVSRELLEKLAAEAQPVQSRGGHASGNSRLPGRLGVRLERFEIPIMKVEPYNGGQRFILQHCPFNPQHGGTSAAIIQTASGAWVFKCLHEECKDKDWQALGQLLEPEATTAKQASNIEWLEPQPLGCELPPTAAFDLEMLPEALRPLVEDIAERMQVPPDFPAVVAIVALGAATGTRAVIQPKRRDTTWKVHGNLWGALVAPSGFMKTPAMAAVLAPIYEIERLWQQEHRAAMIEYERQKKEADLRCAVWEKSYKKALETNKILPSQPDDLPIIPICRRLMTNDATKEKLHVILSENPGGMLVFRDELSGWMSELDSLGREGEKEFSLQGWSASIPYIVDRMGRGTVAAPNMCLSRLGGITPRGLRRYFTDANPKDKLDDGLLQRFQLMVYPDQLRWQYVDDIPNSDAMAQAKATYERLLTLDPAQPLHYKFDDEAQQLAIAWWTELETKVRDGTLHPALVSHLSKYRSLMPALALLFELSDNGSQTTVSLAHAQQAAAWCAFLESHATRIYSMIVSPEFRAAAELGRRLAGGWKRQEGKFTARDVYNSGWSGLDTPERVRGALEMLIDANWIRPLASEKTTGRPSDLYAINPRIKGERLCRVNG